MANEPQRPIEQALRASAQQRQAEAGAPLELHQATRRLLQGEVARTFRKTAEEKPAGWLAGLWPRMALAGSFCAAALVAAFLWFQNASPQKSTELAQLPAGHLAPSSDSFATAPATVPAERLARAQSESLADVINSTAPAGRPAAAVATGTAAKNVGLDSATRSVNPSALPAPQVAMRDEAQLKFSGGVKERADRSDFQLGATPKLALASPAAPALEKDKVPFVVAESEKIVGDKTKLMAGNEGKLALAEKKADDSGAAVGKKMELIGLTIAGQQSSVGQRFKQVDNRAGYRVNFNSPAPPPVLNAFVMEQAGQEVKFIDDDGSTYSGQLRTAQVEVLNGFLPAKPAVVGGGGVTRTLEDIKFQAAQQKVGADREAGVSQNSQNFFFRAVGTNRTLNQAVVFDGNLLIQNESGASQSQTMPVQNKSNAARQQALFPNVQINGRVTIGGRSEQEINAVPAGP